MNTDIALFRIFNSLAGQYALTDKFIAILADYGLYIFLALFLFYSWYQSSLVTAGKWRFVLKGLGIGLVSRFITEIIKVLVIRLRPFLDLENVYLLTNASGFALPSGHSTIYFALAFYIWFADRKWGSVFILMATIFSLARVIAGVHYPLDILVGALIGFITSYFYHQLILPKN